MSEKKYCSACNRLIEPRGWAQHIRSKKHIRAQRIADKKNKHKEEMNRIAEEAENTEDETEDSEASNSENKEEESSNDEIEDIEELEDNEDNEDAQQQEDSIRTGTTQTEKGEPEREESDFLTIRVIDGAKESNKPSGLMSILEKSITPEVVGALGQLLIQAIANRTPSTEAVQQPAKWGYDKHGNAIEF